MESFTTHFDELFRNNGEKKKSFVVNGKMMENNNNSNGNNRISMGNDHTNNVKKKEEESGNRTKISNDATTTTTIMNEDDPDRIDERLERMETEQRELLLKIQEIRERRIRVKENIQKVQHHQTSWMHLRNKVEADRNRALQEYICIRKRDVVTMKALEETKSLNVTNDCFHIWHRGPFATICGFRLGSEVPKLRVYSDPLVESKWTNFFLTDFDKSYFFDTNSSSSTTSSKVDNFARVSWPEINSSLAMAALLLVTLQQKPNSGFIFRTHEIIPMGKHTKIGVRQPNGKPSILYNLCYDEDSFVGTFLQMGRYRNFNTALSGLFMCLREAAEAASERDKAIVLPHPIQVNGVEIMIGGLPITYGVTGRISVTNNSVPDGEQWTRAMKYFLTDLKWLVTYTTKHIDR